MLGRLRQSPKVITTANRSELVEHNQLMQEIEGPAKEKEKTTHENFPD